MRMGAAAGSTWTELDTAQAPIMISVHLPKLGRSVKARLPLWGFTAAVQSLFEGFSQARLIGGIQFAT